MKRAIFLIYFVFLASIICGQDLILSGSVSQASSGNPLPNAYIQLLNQDSIIVSTAASEKDGRFSLKCGKGDFHLYVHALNFRPYSLELKGISQSTEVGDIRLDSISVALEEVVIQSNRLVRKTDRIVAFPSTTQKRYAHDGYTLLRNLSLPKIQVDFLSGNVSAPGGKVTLCIDGREVTQDEVKALRPKDILRVEYHDSPTGEFADKYLVVNFITVKRVSGGYIAMRADQERRYGSYSLTAKTNYKNSDFTWMYTPGYLNDPKVYAHVTECFRGMDTRDFSQIAEGIPSSRKKQNHSVYTAYNHRTENQTVNVSGGYNYQKSPLLSSFSKQYSSFDDQQTITEQSTQSHSHIAYGTLFYKRNLKKEQILQASAHLQYNGNQYARHYSDGGMYATNLQADETFYNLNASLLYNKTFANKSSLMLQFAHFYQTSDILYRSTEDSKEKLKQSETLLFLIYTYPLNSQWTLMGRLGADYLSYRQTDEEKSSYFSPRPSLSLRFRPNQSLYFNLQSYMGNSFPQLSYMNNAEQSIDRWQIRRGNPDLKQTLYVTNQLDIWSQLFGGQLQAFLKHAWSINNIRNHTLIENGKFVQTYSTEGDSHLVTANLSYSKTIANCFSFYVSGGWQRTSITGTNATRHSEWYGSFSMAYFKKGFYVGMEGRTARNQLSGDLNRFHSSASLTPYISYYWKGLSAMLYYQDPFWNNNNSQWIDTGHYYRKSFSFNSRKDHRLCLRLTWNFSFGREYKYEDYSRIQTQKNSAILNMEK